MITRDLFDLMSDDNVTRTDVDNKAEDSNKHTIDLVLHYDTGKAILVSETGEESKAVWIPKSQIEIHKQDKSVSATKADGQRTTLPVIQVAIPIWLAKDKGLI